MLSGSEAIILTRDEAREILTLVDYLFRTAVARSQVDYEYLNRNWQAITELRNETAASGLC